MAGLSSLSRELIAEPHGLATLAVASAKGGVGKTTVALHMSHALAERGWRVLLVDTDPQGAIGLSLSRKVSQAPGLAEYVTGQAELAELVVQTRLPTLRLLPVGQLHPEDTLAFANVLANGAVLKQIASHAEEATDVLIIDTPCGFGGITLGALRVATHVLSPIQAEPVALSLGNTTARSTGFAAPTGRTCSTRWVRHHNATTPASGVLRSCA